MATVAAALEAAVSHHQSGDLQQVEDLCRLIIRIDPKQPDALYLLGSSAHQRGRTEEAIDYINRAIAVSESASPFYCELGDVYRTLLRFDDALESYEEAVRVSPDDAEAHFNLGKISYEYGDLEKAHKCYMQGLELDGDFVDGQVQLAEILELQQCFTEAIEHYRQAIQQRPGSALLHYKLAEACLQSGRLDEATENFHKALHLDSEVIASCHPWRATLRSLVKVDDLSRRVSQSSEPDDENAEQKLLPHEVLKHREELAESVHRYEEAVSTQKLAENVLNEILVRIEEANNADDPISHFTLDVVFGDDFLRQLIKNLPDEEFYEQQTHSPIESPEGEFVWRTFTLDEKSIRRLPQSAQEFWSHYSAVFYSKRINWALFSIFRREIPGNLQVILTRGISRDEIFSHPAVPDNAVVFCCTFTGDGMSSSPPENALRSPACQGIAFEVFGEDRLAEEQRHHSECSLDSLMIVYSDG